MRSWISKASILVLAELATILTFGSTAALCQAPTPVVERAQFGIGYVANAPESMAGIGGYVILPALGGIGLYLDAKFDPTDPSDKSGFEAGLTAEQVRETVPGNEFIKDESSWQSFNAAVVRPLNPYLIVYAGGGVAKRTVFELYEEPSGTWGMSGVLWVEAPDREETRVNFMLGAILRLSSRISTHFGFETEPTGVTVGASVRVPRW